MTRFDSVSQDLFTGRPSLPHAIVAFIATIIDAVISPFNGGLLAIVTKRIPLLTNGVPPFFFNFGLEKSCDDFECMGVLKFKPRRPSGKVVAAIHGGAYVGQATIFHWWTYTNLARHTGATVLVPDYTLSPQGTAATEVPRMANFLETLVGAHGADFVTVLGDSAGGGLALLAMQELVRRGASTPSRLVMLAPWLDVSATDSRLDSISDPLLDRANAAKYGKLWAGGLDTKDPRVSPLYGPLHGLPVTHVYSSSRDMLTPDTLRLRERVLAANLANFTFRLRNGLLHDYPIYVPLPDARADRTNLHRDLGLVD